MSSFKTNSSPPSPAPLHLYFLGDSDISKFPLSREGGKANRSNGLLQEVLLYTHEEIAIPSTRFAKYGATISSLNSLLKSNLPPLPTKPYLLICTVGENDLPGFAAQTNPPGSINTSILYKLNQLIDILMEEILVSHIGNTNCLGIIFFGPKIEPWMFTEEDGYDWNCILIFSKFNVLLNNAFAALKNEKLIYVDTLTKFITQNLTKFVTLSGDDYSRFTSQELHSNLLMRYASKKGGHIFTINNDQFENDQLHLSECGYQIWKEIINEHVDNLFGGSLIASRSTVIPKLEELRILPSSSSSSSTVNT